MKKQNYTLVTSDNTHLYVHQWLPLMEPRAVVHILHGVAEHGGRYDDVASRLARAGYAVYAHDQRGHGRTASDEDQLGFFAERDGWARVMDDTRYVNAHVRECHPGVPRVMIGHSMGSLLAQQYAIDHGDALSALVLSGTAYPRRVLSTLLFWVAKLHAEYISPRLRSTLLNFLTLDIHNYTVNNRRGRYDWLSRDESRVSAYAADPLCGFRPTVSLWRDVTSCLRYVGKPANIARIRAEMPVLLLAGGNDSIGANGRRVVRLRKAYSDAGVFNVGLRIYAGGRHEIFSEINREQVVDDLLDWLNKRMPAWKGEQAGIEVS